MKIIGKFLKVVFLGYAFIIAMMLGLIILTNVLLAVTR